ncbi:putative glucokinase regulator family protein [Cadophora sp. MPI-SDFR-AT-0126]|nr:putative glucokinase regulator family protein [Leotiomycetes sp. MPI-SDFR-AT-0126]
MTPTIVLDGLQTESRNTSSSDIDEVSTYELCQIINKEDATVATAVNNCLPVIAEAIDDLANRVRRGGRVIYVGAGTSGRLGVVDASEIPPTYSAPGEQFIALIAGGDAALRHAQEGAEDDIVAAETDLKALNMDGHLDSLIGIAASGRTPYVLRCLSFAKSLGCVTVGIACCEPSAMGQEGNVDHLISLVTGPEVVTGSTRMKAGTGTKMALNMLSTGIMIKVGKTYGNMMIDVKSSNLKLQQRSKNIIRTICGKKSPSSEEELEVLLAACSGSVKLAVATILLEAPIPEAKRRLDDAGGVLADVLQNSRAEYSEPSNTGNYVLCVDGGGSKCGAVILGKNGETGQGEAGECNVSSVGLGAAVSSISLAIQRAVDSCPEIQGTSFKSIPFQSVWIGLAGYDRPNIADRINGLLLNLFHPDVRSKLRISNDIELLANAVADKNGVDSVVVLVAGTGSIAMSFERIDGRLERTGRSGGWGHLLGDDGSGYGTGRQALRLALESVDEIDAKKGKGQTQICADPLVPKIFEHFGLKYSQESPINLLNEILSLDSCSQEVLKPTKRIAEVAKVVVDSSSSSKKAMELLKEGSKSLIRMLSSLVVSQELDTSKISLILAGGLLQSEVYQGLLLHDLASAGLDFRDVQAVQHPALVAAKTLLGKSDEI